MADQAFVRFECDTQHLTCFLDTITEVMRRRGIPYSGIEIDFENLIRIESQIRTGETSNEIRLVAKPSDEFVLRMAEMVLGKG